MKARNTRPVTAKQQALIARWLGGGAGRSTPVFALAKARNRPEIRRGPFAGVRISPFLRSGFTGFTFLVSRAYSGVFHIEPSLQTTAQSNWRSCLPSSDSNARRWGPL